MRLNRFSPPRGAACESLIDWIVAQNTERAIYLSREFVQAVITAILAVILYKEAPRIHIFAGAPGVGKTVMLRETLYRAGVGQIMFDASRFESQWAGEPAEQIRAAYEEAVRKQQEKERPYGVIFNDWDLASRGADEDMSTTKNLDLNNAALMEIADKREPVVIFGTANAVHRMYGPLVRDGRTRVHEWSPSEDDIRAIAGHIMQGWLHEDDFDRLFDYASDWPLARWTELKARLQDNRLVDGLAAASRKHHDVLSAAVGGELDRRDLRIDAGPASDRELETALQQLEASDHAKRNFLES